MQNCSTKPIVLAGALVLLMMNRSICLPSATLDDYVSLAWQNNPALKASFKAWHEAMERIPQAGTLPDPDISLGTYLSPVETRVGARIVDIELSQTFPWFGTLAAKKDAASKWAEAAYQAFVAHKAQIRYDVADAYYQIYQQERVIAAQSELIAIIEKLEKQLLTGLEAAKTAMTDILKVQMEKEKAILQLKNQQETLKVLHSKMEVLVGQNIDTAIVTEYPIQLTPLHEKTRELIRVSENPSMKYLHTSREALKHEEELAQYSGRPNIKAGVGYAMIRGRSPMDFADNGKDVLLSRVSLSIPLNRRKYGAAVREIQLRGEQLTLQLSEQQNQLQHALNSAYADYRNARQEIEVFSSIINKAEQTRKLSAKAFEAALSGYEDYLETEKALLNYKLELEKSKARHNIAAAKIEAIMYQGE